jgi:hypothetical protein
MNMENICWVCEEAMDKSKPVKMKEWLEKKKKLEVQQDKREKKIIRGDNND